MATLRQEAEQLAKEEESLNQELEIAKQEREKHKAAVQTETSSTTQAVVTSNSIQRMSYAELQTAIEQQEKAVSKLAGKSGQEAEAKRQADLLKQMKARYASLGQQYGIKEGSKGGGKNDFDGKHLIASAATYKQLENNIRYYEEQLKKTDPQEKATIQNLTALKQAAEADLQAVKAMLDEYNRPTSLDTLEDIDKEIQYQRTLRSKATADNIGDIDKEIKRLDGLRQAMEQSGHVELTTMNISEQVTSYERLNQELTFYQQRLNQANTDVARAEAQALIDRLNELKAAWDAALGSKTGDASKVNTLREVDAALSYWQQHLQTVTGDELTATQATINALQKKRTALMGLANISTGEVELGDLKNLTDKELTIRLRAIGIEGVHEKIRALQETLKSGAVTGQQEAAIKGQIAQWQQYEQRLRRADVTFGKVYGDIKGVGNSIKSFTNTLKNNGNAWDIVTGAIDMVMQMYTALDPIIKMVSATSTAATATEVSNSAMKSTANTTEATTSTLAAAGNIFKAHSSIPFAGIAIAAAAVAAMVAIMAGLPKFADGAVAYGPTLGLFGEYANASRNPEVVAPLDRLRALLGVDGGSGEVDFRLRVRGRDLVAVGNKRNKLTRRS